MSYPNRITDEQLDRMADMAGAIIKEAFGEDTVVIAKHFDHGDKGAIAARYPDGTRDALPIADETDDEQVKAAARQLIERKRDRDAAAAKPKHYILKAEVGIFN